MAIPRRSTWCHSREPALFTLLVDSSQSMKIRSSAVRATAVRLLAAIAADDQVVVAPFSRSVTTVTGPTTTAPPCSTPSPPFVIRVERPSSMRSAKRRPCSRTRLVAGLSSSSLTDTTRTASPFRCRHREIEGERRHAYVIGVGGIAGVSHNGETLLKRLCEETGGRAWFPRDDQQLGRAYDAIAGEVHQKYLLTYTPRISNETATGDRSTSRSQALSIESAPARDIRLQSRRLRASPRVLGSGSRTSTAVAHPRGSHDSRGRCSAGRRLPGGCAARSPSCWHSIRAAA